ncbi:MAG: hypothetical protein ACUVRJ_03225 [Candidatus Villigracilaceae bacterium]
MPTFRDVEKISAYLDGQLPEAEKRRLTARLESDPQLAAVAEDLRQARALLRQTPRRGVPRNFVLTPHMAGIKPPVPRIIPLMRLASGLAAILFFITFAVNTFRPPMVNAPMAYGGMGGNVPEEASAEPLLEMKAAPPSEVLPRQAVAAVPEAAPTQALSPASEEPFQPKAATIEPQQEPLQPTTVRRMSLLNPWLIGLAGVAILLGGGAFVLLRLNDARWRRRLPRQ